MRNAIPKHPKGESLPENASPKFSRVVLLSLCTILLISVCASLLPRFKAPVELTRFNTVIYNESGELRGTLYDPEPPLPVRDGDSIQLNLEVTRPTYFYVVWIGTDGRAKPIYPWRDYRWSDRYEEHRTDSLRWPADQPVSMEVTSPGIETILLMTRSEPLPDDFDIASYFMNLPAQKRQRDNMVVFFEDGQVVTTHRKDAPLRMPVGFLANDQDPIVVSQAALRRQLADVFDRFFAVSFSCYKEQGVSKLLRGSKVTRAVKAPVKLTVQPNFEMQQAAFPHIQDGQAAAQEAEFDTAANAFTRAMEALDPSAPDYEQLLSLPFTLRGDARRGLGQYALAREDYEHAFKIVEQAGSSLAVLLRLEDSYARLMRDAGEYQAAIDGARDIKALLDASSAPLGIRAAINSNLSSYLSEQSIIANFDEAVALAESAVEMERATQSQKKLHFALNNLGFALAKRGQHEAALKQYRVALRLRKQLKPPRPQLVSRSFEKVAETYLALGKTTQALQQYEQAEQIAETSYGKVAHKNHARCLNGYARALGTAGQWEEALALMQRADAIDVQVAARFVGASSDAESLNFLTYNLGPPGELLSLWESTQAEVGLTEYARVVRRKSLIMRRIRDRNRLVWDQNNDQAFVKYQSVLQRLNAFASQENEISAQANHRRRKIEALNEEKEELERSLGIRFEGPDNLPEVLREVVDALPDDAVILDFSRYSPISFGVDESLDDRYAVFSVGRNEIRLAHIENAAEIDELLWQWRSDISAGRTSAAGKVLGRRLWKPLEGIIPAGTKHLICSPDGALSALPWAAVEQDNGRPLIESYSVLIAPHIPSLQSLAAPIEPPSSLLLVGDIEYTLQEPLPGAARELTSIESIANTESLQNHSLTRKAATFSNLVEHGRNADWTHFAAHGGYLGGSLSHSTRPWGAKGERRHGLIRNPFSLSGIYLSEDATNANGFVSAQLLAHQDFRGSKGVVLSACNSAIGDASDGEGVFSLQRALHAAGVSTVVASLWPIEDEATREFMSQFYYKMLSEEVNPIQALTVLQREASLSGKPKANWAAFTLSLADLY